MKNKILLILIIGYLTGHSQLNYDSINRCIDTSRTIKNKLATLYNSTKNVILNNKDYTFVEDLTTVIVNSVSSANNRALGYYYLGWIYYGQKKLNESIEYFFKCLEIAEQNKNYELMGNVHNRLAYSFNDLKNIPFAKKHYTYALKSYYSNNKKEDISEVYNMLGTIYKNENVLDSALYFHKKALEIRIQLGNKKLLASTYNNIGLVYKKQKNYELALDYLKLALQIRKDINDKKGIAGASINIGNVLVSQNKNKEALEYIKIGTQLAYEIGAADFYKNGIDALADCYFELGDFKQAALFTKRYKKINDSLATEQVNKQISELAAQYESTKKDAEILLQEEKLKNQQSEIKKQQLFIGAVVLVLLLVVLLIIFVYRNNRINKKNALDLKRKNVIIEQKNKEITDSINYARRIQNSILVPESILEKQLPEHFILYKPKDIVSGDFYWFHAIDEGCSLIAAADCTGHGVPGAFMSLIGKEKLDKAVVESESPSEILNYLNINVKSSLQQDANQLSRDGMDISIIKLQIAPSGANVIYAGANRPLWIIRRDSNEIEEIKATKQAIAGFTDDAQLFEEHALQLQSGDTIFLFTDGYADQFGGDHAKKLTSKSFKKLLLSQKSKNMTQQKHYYNEFIRKWMTGQEQIDDILVIGIRV